MADELYDDDGNLTMFPHGTAAQQGLEVGGEQGMNMANAGDYDFDAQDVEDEGGLPDEEFFRTLDPRLRGDLGVIDQLEGTNADTTLPADLFNEFSAEVDQEYGNNEEADKSKVDNQQQKKTSHGKERYLGPALDQARNPTDPNAANRVGVEQQERAEQLPKATQRQFQNRFRALSTVSSSTSSSGQSSRVPSLAQSLHSFSSMTEPESIMEDKFVNGIQCLVFTSMVFHPKTRIVREYHCYVPDCPDRRKDKSWSSFHKHWLNVHAKKPLTCDFEGCDKTATCAAHMRRHQLSHTGVKDFICDDCYRAFSRNDLMNRHKDAMQGRCADE